MIVYGRNPVREALRGPRRVERVWATKNAIRLPWLTDPGVRVDVASAEELEQRCGAPSHQGICASVEPFRYADPQQLLVLPERRSAVVTASVCKASAGAVEHIAVARVRNLVDFLADAKRAGLWCYGADADAATSYELVDYSGGAVLLFGSEGRGLRPRVAASCDLLVSLPTLGRIDSLSVTAAAAVLMYSARSARPSLDRRG